MGEMEERVSTRGCIHPVALSGDALEYRTRAAVTKILSLSYVQYLHTFFTEIHLPSEGGRRTDES